MKASDDELSVSAETEALNHDGETYHTGDDDRVDALVNIRATLEEAVEELDGGGDIAGTLRDAIEECDSLTVLIFKTIAAERKAGRPA